MNNWDLLFLHQEQYVTYFKAGVHVNFTKFKEGLEGKKTSVETPPHSWTPPKGHPRLVGNCLMYVYQFVTSNSIFKSTSDLQNFLFPKIAFLLWEKLFIPQYTQISPSNLQKSPKRKHLTSREIFDRLKQWTRYLRWNHIAQPRYGLRVCVRLWTASNFLAKSVT